VSKSTIKGLDKVYKDFAKLSQEVHKKVGLVTKANAMEISADARKKAPKDLGKLAQGISYEKVDDTFNYKIFAREKYSAYVEFGTGGMVKVPSELKELAIQFKGKGVKEVNLPARPYLYPAFVKGRVKFLDDLNDLLNKETKKI
tara:strand:- start:1963 stop:2394 length:432 start_codon:yes stop_codon:yes gene_type:complete